MDIEQQREDDRARTAAVEDALRAVSRLVVVKDGAYTEHWGDSWRVDVQDGGRTVKFFAVGDGSDAADARAAELGASLGVSAVSAQRLAQAVAAAEQQPDRFGTPL